MATVNELLAAKKKPISSTSQTSSGASGGVSIRDIVGKDYFTRPTNVTPLPVEPVQPQSKPVPNFVQRAKDLAKDFVRTTGLTAFNTLMRPGVAGGDLPEGVSPFDKKAPTVPVSSYGPAKDEFLHQVQTGGKNNIATMAGEMAGALPSYTPVGAAITGGNKLSEKSIEQPGTTKQKITRGAGVLAETGLNAWLGSKSGAAFLNPGEGGLLKSMLKAAIKNLPVGYGTDVALNLQEDKTGKAALKPGSNTLFAPLVGAGSELGGKVLSATVRKVLSRFKKIPPEIADQIVETVVKEEASKQQVKELYE